MWEVNAPPRPLYPQERDPVPTDRRLGGRQGRSGRVRNTSARREFEILRTKHPLGFRRTDFHFTNRVWCVHSCQYYKEVNRPLRNCASTWRQSFIPSNFFFPAAPTWRAYEPLHFTLKYKFTEVAIMYYKYATPEDDTIVPIVSSSGVPNLFCQYRWPIHRQSLMAADNTALSTIQVHL